MKKLILAFVTLSHLAIAQTTEPVASTPKERKIALGLSFSPDYSYRSLKGISANGKAIAELRNNTELPVFAFTSGVKLSTLLKKRFTFETGILFSQKGYKQKPQELISQIYDPAIAKSFAYQITYSGIDVPIKLNFYPVKTTKGGLFISAGIANNLIMSNKVTYTSEYYNAPSQTVKDIKMGLLYMPSLLLSVGYQQQLSERLFLKAEPSYRRALLDLNGSTLIKTYLYSMGLDVSLFLKL